MSANITQDSKSGWFFPNNATEWARMLSGLNLANPTGTAGCQEVGGNLLDLIDGDQPFIANGTPLYQQSVTGFDRKAVGTGPTNNTTNTFVANSGANPSATSVTALMVIDIPPDAIAERTVAFVGGCFLNANVTPTSVKFRAYPNATATNGVNSLYNRINRGPMVVIARINKANNTVVWFLRDNGPRPDIFKPEVLRPVGYTASTDVGFYFGGVGQPSVIGAKLLYASFWIGANAEAFTDEKCEELSRRVISGPPAASVGDDSYKPRTRGRASVLLRMDEVEQALRPVDSIGAIGDMTLAPNALDTQASAMRTLGWGKWNYGWSFNDAASPVRAAWGGQPLQTASQGQTFRERGMRIDDRSVGLWNAGYLFLADATALDVGATDDLAWLLAIPDSRVFANASYLIIKSTFSAGPEYYITGLTDGTLGFTVRGGGLVQVNLPAGTTAPGVPFVLGMVCERGTAKARIAAKRIGGNVVMSAETSIAGVGSMSNAAGLNVGIGSHAQPVLYAHAMACWGLDAAKGVSANLDTIVSRYADAMVAVPTLVDAAAGRGRSFVAQSRNVYEANDVQAGDTLHTRDMSVQAIVKWDASAQAERTEWRMVGHGTSGTPWDSGASSYPTFTGDFEIECDPGAVIVGDWRTLAVSPNSGVSYDDNPNLWFWYFQSTNTAAVRDPISGRYADAATTTFANGDRFSIRRVGATISFLKNGAVFYTSASTTAAALRVRAHFFNEGARLPVVRSLSGGPITWEDLIKVDATPYKHEGELYARGDDIETSYLSGGVELRAVSAQLGIGEIGWTWRTASGALKRQVGAQFYSPSGYIMVTATRRWYSPTRVVLSYYLGDRLIGEIESTDGDIGGSTTGRTFVGGRRIGGYPLTAAAMESATRAGTKWVAGYRANVANGNIAPLFGSLGNAIATSTPTYGNVGPRAAMDGVDAAVGFNSNADAFQLGDNLDIATTEDFAFAWVGYHDAYPLNVIMNKYDGSAPANGYYLTGDGVNTFYWRTQLLGALDLDVFISALPIKRHYIGMCVIDRSTGKGRLATCDALGAVQISAEGNIVGAIANVQPLCIGASPWLVGSTNTQMAAWWFAHGVGACTGLSANLEEAVRNLGSTVFGTYGNFLAGTIDEMRVIDRALTREEVEATWRRLTQWQPQAEQLVLDSHPPGWPVDLSASTDAGKETRMWGQGLGHAAADIEVLREYTMPDRAFGDVLEQWEDIARQTPRAFDDEAKRRSRIIGHIRQRAGVSPDGVRAALEDLVGTDPDNLELTAYSQEAVDNTERIDVWQGFPLYMLRKVGGVLTYDSAAESFETIDGDGYIEWIVSSVGQSCYIGLTAATEAYSVNPSDIDYAIRWDVTDYTPYMNGAAPIGVVTGLALFDYLKLERKGNTITWYRNNVAYYSTTVTSIVPLRAVIAMASANGAVLHLAMVNTASDGIVTRTGLDWRLSGLMSLVTPAYSMPYGDARTYKTGAVSTWDARARTNETLSGDCYVEWRADSVAVNTYRSVSLTVATDVIGGDISENSTDYAFGLGAIANQARVVERGGLVVTGFALAVGDTMRIERVGSTVYYKINGTTVYTSLKASTGDLVIDVQHWDPATRIIGLKAYASGVRQRLTWDNRTLSKLIAISDGLQLQHSSGDFMPMTDYQGKLDPQWTTWQEPISHLPLVKLLTGEQAEGFGAVMSAFVGPVALPTFCEVGIAFYDLPRKNVFMFGLRNEAGTYKLATERFADGVSNGVNYVGNTTLVPHWLRMRIQAPRPVELPGNEQFWLTGTDNWWIDVEWSTTSYLTGFSPTRFNAADPRYQRAVVYMRSIDNANNIGAAANVYVDDVRLFTPFGDRPFRFHVYRNPLLPGAYDLPGANAVIRRLKQAHTNASVATSKRLLAGDPLNGCGMGPCGG